MNPTVGILLGFRCVALLCIIPLSSFVYMVKAAHGNIVEVCDTRDDSMNKIIDYKSLPWLQGLIYRFLYHELRDRLPIIQTNQLAYK